MEEIVNTTIAGKQSIVVGKDNTQLVLKGLNICIQQGNRFVDLAKYKQTNTPEIFKTANSIDELSEDGIYLMGNQLYIVIKNTKIKLTQVEVIQ